MKKTRLLCLALTAALLAGCGGPGEEPVPAKRTGPPAPLFPQEPAQPRPEGPRVQVDWSVLGQREAPLPAVGGRWYPDYRDQLEPSGDYGELIPFKGAVNRVMWMEEESWTCHSYGLMTVDGRVVLDPVCSGISPLYLTGEDGTETTLPVLVLEKGDPVLGETGDGTLLALCARDGSWVTGFQYWGVRASPLGVFAGDGQRLYLLSQEDGGELDSWSWAQLGISEPESFSRFTGDAYSTTQWTQGGLFLGCWGENWGTARFLDPATGEVTTCPAQEWYERCERRFANSTWWESRTDGEGTVTLSRGEEVHTFHSPLPQDGSPYLRGGDRVIFECWDPALYAVTDLDGTVILPAGEGRLLALTGMDRPTLWFAVRPLGETCWQIYDRDGTWCSTLPGEAGSWCCLSGPLVEVLAETNAAYYRPQTGECVLRTFFTLGG